ALAILVRFPRWRDCSRASGRAEAIGNAGRLPFTLLTTKMQFQRLHERSIQRVGPWPWIGMGPGLNLADEQRRIRPSADPASWPVRPCVRLACAGGKVCAIVWA